MDVREKCKSHGIKDGLTNTGVESISEDEEGRLWMGTVNGLFRSDYRTSYFCAPG